MLAAMRRACGLSVDCRARDRPACWFGYRINADSVRELGSANFAVSFYTGWPHSLDSEAPQLGDIRRHRSGVLTLRRDSFRRQLFLQKLSTELFHERAGRRQIGKTPSKIDLTFTNSPTSMTRLNFARPMKAHYAAAEFDIQFIIGDWDLDDVRIFPLVCDRLPDRWLEWSAHNDPTR